MMPSDDTERKLTPAAREALDELVSDFREQILRRAEASAAAITGQAREISVHDIVRGVRPGPSRVEGRHVSGLDTILRLYTQLGLLLGVGGLGFFILRDIVASQDLQDRLALLVSLTGFMLASASYAYVSLRRSSLATNGRWNEPESSEPAGLYLLKWRDIELALRAYAASRFGESAASEPLSGLLSRLLKYAELSRSDHDVIRSLLQLRNAIMHERGTLSRRQIQESIRQADDLLERLKLLSEGGQESHLRR